MRKFIAFLLIACSIAVVSSCKKDDPNIPEPPIDPEKSEYTIMFYGLGSGLDSSLYISLFDEVPDAKVSKKLISQL